ncbi:U3 small nucleolar RNA-associated protein 17 [Golovinomyces cichoracearum]|uniref:U3 small nucleolar RNA-associated protein 17 n=1 Tax=Golovinomyces cichoracearum TaxID=62708 RepID=A0A420ILR7_9PEZI|nr:U3 small nucleolar RNA-associated protein 17 [Golovinomyces cichoracearum]
MSASLKRKRSSLNEADSLKRTKTVNSQITKPAEASASVHSLNNETVQDKSLEKDSNIKICEPANSSIYQGVGETSNHAESSAAAAFYRNKIAESWFLSPPIGGRMIRSDPVFSVDEKFLIAASRATINVTATTSSLLIRSIKLKLDPIFAVSTQIVTICLSPSKSNILWVACSDGSIFSVDWTTGAGADSFWTVSSTGCIHMTVASMESNGRKRDVIFTTENRKDGGYRTTANELADPNGPIAIATRTIYTSKEPIQCLQAAIDGSVIVGASGNRILVGRLRSAQFDTVDKIKFEFRILESRDYITSIDIKLSKRSDAKTSLKNKTHRIPIVDLVVGNIRGVIFIHSDLAGKLFSQFQNEAVPSLLGLMPSKLHWHRQTVHSVKWSLDGNYIISGGKENVLVLWQLETGKRQFLPHMSAVIENIVVSPKGSSYAIQLSDNSLMALSTADLLPKMIITGIQTPIIQSSKFIDRRMQRNNEESFHKPLIQRIPAIMNPINPSQILLAVGSVGEITANGPFVLSNPLLQTFDLATCKSTSIQALTRTNVTNTNSAPSTHILMEPRVTKIEVSSDGSWLATVDEWTPPNYDYEFLNYSGKDPSTEKRYRREVYLKFWQFKSSTSVWELVSRIDMPHLFNDGSGDSGSILDLSADPSSLRFATIGTDRTVKIWHTKSRVRDGVLVRGTQNEVLKSWRCLRTIQLEKSDIYEINCTVSNSLPLTGCLSYSEDGSALAAVLGGKNARLHIINPESGDIRRSYSGLIEDEIFGLKFLGQDLIILSNRLQSFDIILEETRHILKLRSSTARLSTDQKREMMHLAVSNQSKTFAVALPKLSTGVEPLLGARSELAVFHQDMWKPLHNEMSSSLITALFPAISSEGYVILDACAEIHTILPKGTHKPIFLAQSTSALRLDAPAGSDDQTGSLPDEGDEIEDVPSNKFSKYLDEAYNTDDQFPVVTQNQLAQILDVGPSFALPPIEELFYQVAGLFTNNAVAPIAC